MSTLIGNTVIAQSGGPTAVINASACGILDEARAHGNALGEFYGANNGVLGLVQEDLFDLGAEDAETLDLLRVTPSSSIGSCRYMLGDPDKDRDKYERLLAVLEAHQVRYFFYIGGNNSMDTAEKLDLFAAEKGYELRVLGVPKTVNNDLLGTDHSPGFPSAAKYLAASILEAGRDTEAMYTFDPVTIVEVMGRNTGWMAAAAGLACRQDGDAPHLIYTPEIPFNEDRFLLDVADVHRRLGRVFVVVSEGIKNERGLYLAAQAELDAFGNRQLGGVAETLCGLVRRETGLKARFNKPGTFQRNAIHYASRTDADEAYRVGRDAVRLALDGMTGQMVALGRDTGPGYRCETGPTPLNEVANRTKALPRDFLNVAGTHISDKMREYTIPLLQGEVALRPGPDGLPLFARLARKPVPRKLPPFVGKKP